jgi:hypothetical protein
MSKNFSPGQEVEFTKEALVFEQGSNESYKVAIGTKGIIVEDKDTGEAGECQVEIEKEGGKKVIVEANDQNIEEVD